jgi:hypothetical protein
MRCDAQRATEISQNKTRLWPVGSSELARVRRGGEGDEGDEVIMSIAGQVSRASAVPYSHLRMEAKSRAPDEIAERECRRQAQERSPSGGGVRRWLLSQRWLSSRQQRSRPAPLTI